MEDSVAQRVKELMLSKKLSQDDLAKFIDVSPKQVSNWFHNVSDVRLKHIIVLLNTFQDVSAEWLVLGRGTIQKSGLSSNFVGEPRIDYGVSCVECLRKEGQINFMEALLEKKDLEILGLREELISLRLDNRKM